MGKYVNPIEIAEHYVWLLWRLEIADGSKYSYLFQAQRIASEYSPKYWENQ